MIGSAFRPTRLWQLVNEEARCEVLNRPSFGRADIAVPANMDGAYRRIYPPSSGPYPVEFAERLIRMFITRKIKIEILDGYTRSAEILVQSMSEPNSHVRGVRNVIREDRKN